MNPPRSNPPPPPRAPYATSPGPGPREPSTLEQTRYHAEGAHHAAIASSEKAEDARAMLQEIRRNELGALVDQTKSASVLLEDIARDAAACVRRLDKVARGVEEIQRRQTPSEMPMRAPVRTGQEWDLGTGRFDVPSQVAAAIKDDKLDAAKKADDRRFALKMAVFSASFVAVLGVIARMIEAALRGHW